VVSMEDEEEGESAMVGSLVDDPGAESDASTDAFDMMYSMAAESDSD